MRNAARARLVDSTHLNGGFEITDCQVPSLLCQNISSLHSLRPVSWALPLLSVFFSVHRERQVDEKAKNQKRTKKREDLPAGFVP